jgi:hypothetical protein
MEDVMKVFVGDGGLKSDAYKRWLKNPVTKAMISVMGVLNDPVASVNRSGTVLDVTKETSSSFSLGLVIGRNQAQNDLLNLEKVYSELFGSSEIIEETFTGE